MTFESRATPKRERGRGEIGKRGFTMKAVIYARFSSDRQREESIDGQIRECTEYAEKNGIKIVDSYIDRALSASKGTEKRLDFQRMIQDSAKHLFDVVLVWKLDRFARNRYDSAHYKSILKKNGVKVVSATEHIAEGPEGIILESMLEGMAEYYSAELSEKIRRGQTENALKAQNNGSRPPFGYRLVEHKLAIDTATAPVALEIFKQYADGKTIRDIIKDLTDRGIRTTTGSTFTYSTLGNMLKNRTYIGEYHYSATVIPGGVPAIIPEDIFERVQSRMEKNRHAPAAKKAHDEYLLTGKIFCGDCGRAMVGESGKSHTGAIHCYYKCGSAKRKQGCHSKAVKKDWIENIVVGETVKLINNDELMERLIDTLAEAQDEKSFALALLEEQAAEVEKGIKNMLNAIQAGIITASTKQRLDDLEEQREQLEEQILKEKIKRPALTREQIRYYIYRFRNMDTAQKDQRQNLIDNFVNAVYVFSDRIAFFFNYTEGSKTIPLEELKREESKHGSDLVGLSPPKPGRQSL